MCIGNLNSLANVLSCREIWNWIFAGWLIGSFWQVCNQQIVKPELHNRYKYNSITNKKHKHMNCHRPYPSLNESQSKIWVTRCIFRLSSIQLTYDLTQGYSGICHYKAVDIQIKSRKCLDIECLLFVFPRGIGSNVGRYQGLNSPNNQAWLLSEP